MPTYFSALFFFTLLLLSSRTNSLSFSSYKTLVSLTNALLNRVASARESRGDFDGANHARELAEKFRTLSSVRGISNLGWDFAWNYVLRGGFTTNEIYQSGVNLFQVLKKLSDLDSDADRVSWAIRNFERVAKLANSFFKSLLAVFTKEGPIRRAVMVCRNELIEGGLLKDLIEVGARDLDALVRLAKDLFFSGASYRDNKEDEL